MRRPLWSGFVYENKKRTDRVLALDKRIFQRRFALTSTNKYDLCILIWQKLGRIFLEFFLLIPIIFIYSISKYFNLAGVKSYNDPRRIITWKIRVIFLKMGTLYVKKKMFEIVYWCILNDWQKFECKDSR